MKKKLGFMLATFMMTSVLVSGVASADYRPSNDLNLNVSVLKNHIQAPSLGDSTYELQEGLHGEITNVSGISVDHSYIWININGTSVLAVDPPVAMF